MNGFRVDDAAFILSSGGRSNSQGVVANNADNGNTLNMSGFGLDDVNDLQLYHSPPLTLIGGFENPTENSI